MEKPVGFFDSGLGGISVLKTAVQLLPNERLIYYGDNGNAPYGIKPREQICACTLRSVEELMKYDIKALVVACNTATSACVNELRQALPFPVIGMEPALKPAHALRKSGQILVMATPATLHLGKFERLMEKYGEGAVPVEGHGLVELIENGHLDDEEIAACLHGLLDRHLAKPTDAIVLGCTHYIFIKDALARVAPGVKLVDGNAGTVRQLEHVLEEKGLRAKAESVGDVTLLTSGCADTVLPLMRHLLTL